MRWGQIIFFFFLRALQFFCFRFKSIINFNIVQATTEAMLGRPSCYALEFQKALLQLYILFSGLLVFTVPYYWHVFFNCCCSYQSLSILKNFSFSRAIAVAKKQLMNTYIAPCGYSINTCFLPGWLCLQEQRQ